MSHQIGGVILLSIKMKPFDPKLAQLSKSKEPCALIVELSSNQIRQKQWFHNKFSNLIFFYERAQFFFQGTTTKIKMFYERPKHRSKGMKEIKKFLQEYKDFKFKFIYINDLNLDKQIEEKKTKKQQKQEKIEKIINNRQNRKQDENVNEENTTTNNKIIQSNNNYTQEDLLKHIVPKSQFEKRLSQRKPGQKKPILIQIESDEIFPSPHAKIVNEDIIKVQKIGKQINQNNSTQKSWESLYNSQKSISKPVSQMKKNEKDSFYHKFKQLEQHQINKNKILSQQIFKCLQSLTSVMNTNEIIKNEKYRLFQAEEDRQDFDKNYDY